MKTYSVIERQSLTYVLTKGLKSYTPLISITDLSVSITGRDAMA